MKERRITSGIYGAIPRWLQNLMWFLWESMDVPEREWFQVFCLSERDRMQKVDHSQNNPPYHKVIVVHAEGETICEKVIILESHSSLTMMLHSEYQGGFEIG